MSTWRIPVAIALSLSLSSGILGCDDFGEDMGNEANSAGGLELPVTGGICPGGATVQGIDVSAYQGTVNWASVKAAGKKFAIARVSDGVNYIDGTFARNWSRMKANGIIRGAYQYFEPSQSATTQANIVIARVGRLGKGDLPVMLDVEATGGQSRTTIKNKIHTWVNRIKAGTGKTPFIYTGAYFWDDNVGTTDFAGYPLNVAWYGTSCPGVPNAWRGHGWKFHQYTSSAHVSGISGNVDADVFNGTLARLKSFAGAGAVNCDRTSGPFTWSCNGVQKGQVCTKLSEPADPDTWKDNYLCSKDNLGIRWSSAGKIAGMRCTQIKESADPHTWNDNYLCVPPVSPFHFHWSSAGAIKGQKCVQWFEPADKDTWKDNYLCWSTKDDSLQERGPFAWSSAGPVDGEICTHVRESADPDTWNDNYFCSTIDMGLKWSSAGAIDGMSCTQIHEGADPHTWKDNFLCAPPDAPYTFQWSSAGPLDPSGDCLAWYESADPDTWDDNYLCWTAVPADVDHETAPEAFDARYSQDP